MASLEVKGSSWNTKAMNQPTGPPCIVDFPIVWLAFLSKSKTGAELCLMKKGVKVPEVLGQAPLPCTERNYGEDLPNSNLW